MSDDKKNLPTRVGPPSGRANERQMMRGVDVGGISKSYRVNADGSETMLKTRNGFPQFTTTKPESAFDSDFRYVFQAYPVIGYSDLSLGLNPGWGGFYRPPSDRTQLLPEYGVPEKPHKELWITSGELDLLKTKELRTYHRGNIDWFPSAGADDPDNITVTWSTARCGGKYTPDGEPNNAEPFYGPHYAPNSYNKLADRFPSVYLDGEKVLQLGGTWRYEKKVGGVLQLNTVDYSSKEGSWVLCSAAVWHTFAGKPPAWRVIALVTDGTTAPLIGQAARAADGTYCEGWDIIASTSQLDDAAFVLSHPPVFNGSATEIAALGLVGSTGRIVIRKFSVPGLAMAEEEADAYGYTETPNQIDGSDAIYSPLPGGGTTKLRDEIPTLVFDNDLYKSEKRCIAIDYTGDTLKKLWRFGAFRRTVTGKERIGEPANYEIQTIDTAAAHQQNIDTIMAIDWSDKGGGSYTEEEAAAISKGQLGQMDGGGGLPYRSGHPDTEGFVCLPEGASVFRWLNQTNIGRRIGASGAIDQTSTTTSSASAGLILPSGAEIYTSTSTTATVDGCAWSFPGGLQPSYTLSSHSVVVTAPVSPIYGESVTLNCIAASYSSTPSSGGDEIEDAVTNTENYSEQRIWSFELRHNAWITGPRDYFRGLAGKSFQIGEPSMTGVSPAVSYPQGAATSTPAVVDSAGVREAFPEYFLMAAHQSGEHFVICPADAPPGYSDAEDMGIYHANADGTITPIDPGLDTSTGFTYQKRFVAPIFYRKKKRIRTEKI